MREKVVERETRETEREREKQKRVVCESSRVSVREVSLPL
jgi:hypothetical protein